MFFAFLSDPTTVLRLQTSFFTMHFRQLAAIAASISFVSALRGFNTGNTQIDGSPKQQSDFAAEFQNQRELAGTDGAFTAARLYTVSSETYLLSCIK